MTIKLVSSLMSMGQLKAREYAVAVVYADHAGPLLGYEQACDPGQRLVARKARLGDVKGVQRATQVLEVLGLIRVHRDTGNQPNLIEFNHRFIGGEGHRWDERWNVLRFESGLDNWEDIFEAEQEAAAEKLHREGVPRALRPRSWPEPAPPEEIARVLRNSGYKPGTPAKRKRAKTKGDTVSGQRPSEEVCADTVSGQIVEKQGGNQAVCADTEAVCADTGPVCADTIVSHKPLEPNKTPPAERQRRQKTGQGALDRPEMVQQAFEIMVIHWIATGAWEVPSGYTGEKGPRPDDHDAERGFALGPRRLSGVVVGLIRPLQQGRKPFMTGRAGALSQNVVKAITGDQSGPVEERMETIRKLKDAVTACRDRGEWTPPPVPTEEREVA